MNVEIGTEAPIFLFWEYLFQIFGILSLQCVRREAHFSNNKSSMVGLQLQPEVSIDTDKSVECRTPI